MTVWLCADDTKWLSGLSIMSSLKLLHIAFLQLESPPRTSNKENGDKKHEVNSDKAKVWS